MNDQISLNELKMFEELAMVRSIRELARRRRTQPGQLSKVIKKLESRLGFRLIERSIAGVVLTREGSNFLDFARQINSEVESFASRTDKKNEPRSKTPIAIVSTSFISQHLVVPVISKYVKENDNFQVVDSQPDEVQWIGLRGICDVAVHIGKKDWPKTWKSIEVGKMRWTLCARKNHKLAAKTTASEAARYPFVIPTYWTPEGLRAGNDQCPMKLSERILGHQTSVAETALSIVSQTDQVAFVPEIMLPPFSSRSDIKKIEVSGWADVSRSVFLSVRTDRLRRSTFEELQQGLKERLSKEIG